MLTHDHWRYIWFYAFAIAALIAIISICCVIHNSEEEFTMTVAIVSTIASFIAVVVFITLLIVWGK